MKPAKRTPAEKKHLADVFRRAVKDPLAYARLAYDIADAMMQARR